MTLEETAKRVRKITEDHLFADADKITDSASFKEDLGADSMDAIELVMAFEEEFGIDIPDDDAEKIITVRDAILYIAART